MARKSNSGRLLGTAAMAVIAAMLFSGGSKGKGKFGCGTIFWLFVLFALLTGKTTWFPTLVFLIVVVGAAIILFLLPNKRKVENTTWMPNNGSTGGSAQGYPVAQTTMDPPAPTGLTTAYTPPAAAGKVDQLAGFTGPILAEGDEFEIVGEFAKATQFEEVRAHLGADYDDLVYAPAMLVNEPNNPHSKNGHAVGVHISGKHVGYISEQENTAFFTLLAANGGSAACMAEIQFGPRPEPGYTFDDNQVLLLVAYPPRLKRSFKG